MVKKMSKIERAVFNLNQRLYGVEAMNRLIHSVQVDSLAKAERLRKLVHDVVNSRTTIRAYGSGVTAVSSAKMNALELFVAKLQPFHAPKGKLPASLRRRSRRG